MTRSGGRGAFVAALVGFVVCVACALVALVSLPMSALGAGSGSVGMGSGSGWRSPAGEGLGAGSSSLGLGAGSSPLGASLVIPGSPEEAQQLRAAALARRANPEALVAREVSRTAYRGLDAARAAVLAREAFPGLVDRPTGGMPALRSGERVTRFLSRDAAALSLPGGKHGVVESLGPIARETSHGRFTPVDLMPVSVGGGGFEPQSATLPVRLPARVSAGVVLVGTGVSLTPVDSRSVPLGGSSGAIDGAGVLYANTLRDADTLVKPTTAGFEIDTLLRSADSPSVLYFKVAVPRGARLTREPRTGLVSVLRGGRPIAVVLAPGAQDAAGTSVGVSMSLSGDTLRLSVDDRSAEYQYPIEVDPEVHNGHDEQLTGYSAPTNWKFTTSHSAEHKHTEGQFTSRGWGENGFLTDEATGTYKGGEYAAFTYETQGESHIYGVEGFNTAETNSEGNAIETTLRIENEHKEVEGGPELLSASKNAERGGIAFGAGGKQENHNAVWYQQSATGEGNHFTDELKEGSVQVQQSVAPVVSYDTTDEKIKVPGGEAVNVLHGANKWMGPKYGAVGYTVNETGMGTAEIIIQASLNTIFEENLITGDKCAGIQCPQKITEAYSYNTEKPPLNGHDYFRTYAFSAAKNEGTAAPEVNVDSEPPYDLTLTGLPSSGVNDESVYHLRGEATDGVASTPSSGVKSLKLAVNGFVLPATKSGTCTPGPCTAVSEWTVSGEALGAGKHTLELEASDYAENFTTPKDYTVTVRHASPLAVSPGSVDPVTGALTLGASDVSISDGQGSLGVSRSYDSRQLKAGEQSGAPGPLGPQWQLSINGAQELEPEPAGSVSLVASNGSRTTFESNGAGGFAAPVGDENLVLAAEEVSGKLKAYLLKDPSAGTTVRYEQLSGAGPWVAVLSEAALSAKTGEKERFEWERSEGITRPKEALAPEPAGVNCTTFVTGCRALIFKYATSTGAGIGEEPSQWREYKGRLKTVSFKAYNPSTKAIEEKPVAEYAYDKQGRLRVEWDPRITPELKTTYGYDEEEGGHVVAVSPPGQQPYLFHYGTTAADSGGGRLLSVTRPAAGTALGSGAAPVNTAVPTLSSTSPVIGTTLEVSGNGTWSNSPLAYSYAWEDCYTYESKETCAAIPGAVNKSYTPQARDAGYTLRAQVTALNADGAGVASSAASKAVPVSTAPAYKTQWGKAGEGDGEFKGPVAAAIGPSGNVWVVDYNNARVQRFSASGTFELAIGWGVSNGESHFEICTTACKAGIAGLGEGMFSKPEGIAINQTTGDVYVVDKGNNRVEEFSSGGSYIRAFGGTGSEPGEMSTPLGIAIVPASGDVWVGDYGNDRVDEFTETGNYIGSFGEKGSGNGQFDGVDGIAFSGGDAYVVDPVNDRVQEFSMSGQYIAKFGAKGTGEGQFETPYGITTEPVSGDLYVGDNGNDRIEEFNPAGTFVTQFGKKGSGNGEFLNPERVAVNSAGDVYVADIGNNRVQEFEPKYSTNNPLPAPPAPGTSAVTTIEYGVPLWGSGAPDTKALSEGEEKAERKEWGQTHDPTEATAVFPADEPMGWPAKDYKRATVSYYDELGRTVNVATPSGGIATSEYNEDNEVNRSLTPDDRATAMAESTAKLREEKSELLDTKSKYNGETTAEKEQEEKEEKEDAKPAEPGTRLLETKGPQHKVRLASGTEEKLAREHVRYSYDEGAPEGGTYDLLTKTIASSEYEGKDHEEHVTTQSYSGQENLGWLLRKPTSVTTNPGGLHLTTTTVYDPNTGKVVETRSPEGSNTALALKQKVSVAGLEKASLPGLAVDDNGNVWVTNENKVEEYSSSGTKLLSVGKAGSGNLEFKEPHGVAIGPENTVWVVDSGNDRVQELNEKGEYKSQFGSKGEGAGEFKAPTGIAFGPSGTIWVTDSGNNRVEKFTVSGTELSSYGSKGSGNQEFNDPTGVAVDARGNVWVVDTGNHRVEELGSGGGYVGQFGEGGTAPGDFEDPSYISIDANGDLWVSDYQASPIVDRVQEFSAKGAYMGILTQGSGTDPQGIAVDGQGSVWVTEAAKNYVEEYSAPAGYLGREYHTQAQTSGEGALSHPNSVIVDPGSGDTWALSDPSEGPGTLTEYSPSGKLILKFAGELGRDRAEERHLSDPDGLAVGNNGSLWVVDGGNDRLLEVRANGSGGVELNLEVKGSEAGLGFTDPVGMAHDSAGNLWLLVTGGQELWGYKGGKVIKANGATLDEAKSVAIDSKGDILVADTGHNRVVEFSPEGQYIKAFGSEGSGNGQLKKPEGIVSTDADGDVWVADTGNHRVEEFNAKGEYVAQFGAKGKEAGQFEAPSAIAGDDEGGLWVTDSGNDTLQKLGPARETKSAHDSEAIYYTAAANSAHAECGGHPEWAELLCLSQPTAQPAGEEVFGLPIVSDEKYNMWDEPELVTEAFEKPSARTRKRTKTMTYDPAGRLLTNEESQSIVEATSLPKVTDTYSSETGAMVEQSTTVGETTKTIKSVYNKLGQLTEYTDADGSATKYVYGGPAVDRQLEELSYEINKEKYYQLYSYSPTTMALEKLMDSAAKTFTASYDVEGKLTSEIYPNAMTAKYTYNSMGEASGIEYEKTAHCATTCPEVWFKETVAPLVEGQPRVRTSTLAKEEYTYDEAGRLTMVNEIPVGKGCKTRLYAYDEDSSRLSQTTRSSATETCATSGGTTLNHTYDSADRLIDSGVEYEAFGNKTKVAAADAEEKGEHELTATFYVDNQTHSQTQNGKTITYNTDPEGRTRETVTKEGATEAIAIDHYSGAGEAISWTSEEEGKAWTRNIPGIGGALTATQKTGGAAVLQMRDLLGNIIATAADSETETKLLSTYNSTEYGLPVNGTPPAKYSWLGASGVAAELPSSGVTSKGGTGYVPEIGETLQTQPVVSPGAPNGLYIAPYESTFSAGNYAAGTAFAAEAPAREAARLLAAKRAACLANRNPATCAGFGIDPSVLLTTRQAEVVAVDLRRGRVELILLAQSDSISGFTEQMAEAISQLGQGYMDGIAYGLDACVEAIDSAYRAHARCRLFVEWAELGGEGRPLDITYQWGVETCWGDKHVAAGYTYYTYPYCAASV